MGCVWSAVYTTIKSCFCETKERSVWDITKDELGRDYLRILEPPAQTQMPRQLKAIDKVKEIVDHFSNGGTKAELLVRGSMANGTATVKSDVDIDLVLDSGERLPLAAAAAAAAPAPAAAAAAAAAAAPAPAPVTPAAPAAARESAAARARREADADSAARQAHTKDVKRRLSTVAKRDKALCLAKKYEKRPGDVDLWSIAANPFNVWNSDDDPPLEFKVLSQAVAAQWFSEANARALGIGISIVGNVCDINRCIKLQVELNDGAPPVEVDLYVKIFIPGHGMAGVNKLMNFYKFKREPFPVPETQLTPAMKWIVSILKHWKENNEVTKKIKSNHIVSSVRMVCETNNLDYMRTDYQCMHEVVFLTLQYLLHSYTGRFVVDHCIGVPNMLMYAMGSPSGNSVKGVLSEADATAICGYLAKEAYLFRRGALREGMEFRSLD